jgi:ATP-binding cassette, subfamily C, bacterial LapB
MIIDKIKKNSNLLYMLILLPGSLNSYLFLILASLFINITALALPIILIQVYDRVIANSALGSLVWLAIGCLVALMIESILRTFRSFLSGWMAANFENEINNNIIEKVIYSKSRDFNSVEVGEHLERINSVAILKSIYSGQIFQFMMDLPFAMIFLFMIYYLAGNVFIVPVLCIFLYYLLLIILKPKVNKLRDDLTNSTQLKSSMLLNLLSNLFSIKASGAEELMLRRYNEDVKNCTQNTHDLNKWINLTAAFSGIISQISLFGVVLFGGAYVIQGKFSIGVVTACIILAGRSISPFIEVGNFCFRRSEIKLATERIAKIADMQPDRIIENEVMENYIYGLVEFKNVSCKRDDGIDYIIKDIDLRVNRKEFVSIKCNDNITSTVLSKIIQGRCRPDAGRFYIDGFESSEWNLKTVNNAVKYFSGNCYLFNGTIIDNITVFNDKRIKAAYETAKMLGIDDYASNMPKGYETVLNMKSYHTVPSGLLYRISLGRALLSKPRIIILDYFDEALDNETKDLLLWLLGNLKNSLTIIAFTSNKSITAIADRKFEINNGKIIEIH